MMHFLLIESDTRQIPGILDTIDATKHTADVAYDGFIGWRLFRQRSYQGVILTPNLPGIGGFELIRSLRAAGSTVPVLVLGTPRSEGEEERARLAGATAFMPRPRFGAGLSDWLLAIEQQHQTEPAWLDVGDLRLNIARQTAYRQGRTIPLSRREYQLLTVLMQRPGHILSCLQLLALVWQGRVKPNCAQLCISMLRRKIDSPFDQPLIRTVVGKGYTIGAPQ
ncbi:response regulator transcription factor [Spirosoma luteolum]